MLNKQYYMSITVMFIYILISSIYIGNSAALKCYVCQNCTNVTAKANFTIGNNCKFCQKIVRLKNGFLNSTTRSCLTDTCVNSNKSESPWLNITTCCTKPDLCNQSVRTTSKMNIQFIWILFSIWIWYNC
ncbi:unnamed protein product [Schistosoma rodhaini]|uniref:UPAR/Ly6 domain-containing protein n=1 Tax=Schistosoma rodhaini TaxID=6188 RepID=A0A183Q8S0_9TREM|nr:unnamed protein product [Schistosoma rodhaini]